MDDVPQSRITLKDWEAWLAPQIRQVELLGEIPITADECAQLGKVIVLISTDFPENVKQKLIRSEGEISHA